jgi:CBS domain-containing protein
MLISP